MIDIDRKIWIETDFNWIQMHKIQQKYEIDSVYLLYDLGLNLTKLNWFDRSTLPAGALMFATKPKDQQCDDGQQNYDNHAINVHFGYTTEMKWVTYFKFKIHIFTLYEYWQK